MGKEVGQLGEAVEVSPEVKEQAEKLIQDMKRGTTPPGI